MNASSNHSITKMTSIATITSVTALILALTGCAYVPLPPLGSELTTQTLEPDEQHLWKKSREIQHEIEISGLHFEDPELDAYLSQVLRRSTPPEVAAAGIKPEVNIISNVNINGYSFANGVIYIHTALLSRMRNETELATLLTRELSHVVHRHALRSQRDKRAQADTLAWVGVGASLVEGGGDYKLLIQAASMTSAVGFHHLLETTADDKGLDALAAAGYGVRETPAFFKMTTEYLGKVHRQGQWAWVNYAPPVQMTARIAGYERLINAKYPNQTASKRPIATPEQFRRKVQRATLRQASLEMASGLFLSAEDSARLATESNARDPEAWTLLGQALAGQRLKTIQGESAPAIRVVREAFEQALRLDSRHPVATRELGMTFYRTTRPRRSDEETREARRLFRRYLSLRPQAEDANYIRAYIKELEAS